MKKIIFILGLTISSLTLADTRSASLTCFMSGLKNEPFALHFRVDLNKGSIKLNDGDGGRFFCGFKIDSIPTYNDQVLKNLVGEHSAGLIRASGNDCDDSEYMLDLYFGIKDGGVNAVLTQHHQDGLLDVMAANHCELIPTIF